MKDPLQTTETPYEILGIEPTANAKELRVAFMAALRNGVPHNKAQDAFNKLLEPKNLIIDNILIYQSKNIEQISPSPLEDIAVLDPYNRLPTAKAWEKSLTYRFPDIGMTHNLAVLWYWWVKHEEQRYESILDAARNKNILTLENITKQKLLQSLCKYDGIECNPVNKHNCPSKKQCCWQNDCFSTAPELVYMWEKVIGYWTTLIVMSTFWAKFGCVIKAEVRDLQKEIIDSLRNELLNRYQYYMNIFGANEWALTANNLKLLSLSTSLVGVLQKHGICSAGEILQIGANSLVNICGVELAEAEVIVERARKLRKLSPGLPEQYQTLELVLMSNLQTAKYMLKVGVKTANGKICSGPLMLRDMKLLDDMQKQFELKLKADPQSDKLQTLVDALSPYALIIMLLKENKMIQALEEIECLPEEYRKSSKALKYKVHALFLLGNQKERLGQIEEALESWKLALSYNLNDKLHGNILEKIADSCHSHAMKLKQYKQLEKAIAILEKAIELNPAKILELTLANILTERGIKVLNDVYDIVKQDRNKPSDETINICKNAISDLEKAAKMGSDRARDNIEAAHKLIKDMETILPGGTQKLVDNAYAEEKNKNWKKAIQFIEQAIKANGTDTPIRLFEDLAWDYFNLGLDSVNHGIDVLNKSKDMYERLYDEMVNTISARLNPQTQIGNYQQFQALNNLGATHTCAHCSRNQNSAYHDETWYNYTLDNVGKVLLCQGCSGKLDGIMNNLKKPNREAIKWLKDGEKEIVEGTMLDPSNDRIKEELKKIHDIFTTLNIPIPRTPSLSYFSKMRNKILAASLKPQKKKKPISEGSPSTSKKKTNAPLSHPQKNTKPAAKSFWKQLGEKCWGKTFGSFSKIKNILYFVTMIFLANVYDVSIHEVFYIITNIVL